MRRSCPGLLLLRKAETGWKTAVCGAAARAFLDLRPSFGQQLLLRVAVGQGANARVRLPFGGALLGLDAASWYAVALHQPGVSLVLGHGAGLGAGAQLVCHGALGLRPSLRVVVLTLVAVSALLSWEAAHSSLVTTAEKRPAACNTQSSQCVNMTHLFKYLNVKLATNTRDVAKAKTFNIT